jgi:hypothetical protein
MLENYVMPKVLVLFDSGDEGAERLADWAAAGAKKVRFSEVDIRDVGNGSSSSGARLKRFEPGDGIEQYDGVVVVGWHREPLAAIDALRAGHPRANGEFVDRVFATLCAAHQGQGVSDLGGIVIGAPPGSTDLEMTARKIGERVAKVGEWVRHALSHEHGHGDSHQAHAHHHSH